MILERGDMFDIYGRTGLFLVTTNAIVTKDDKLVMGAGIAKQMRDRFPGSDKEFAQLVRMKGSRYTITNLYHEPTFGKQTVGMFRVKDHWADDASIPIIMRSTAALIEQADQWQRIDLNFPGIGNGRLKKADVLPLMEYLPDNVHVWEFA